jgi:hypothetical protein
MHDGQPLTRADLIGLIFSVGWRVLIGATVLILITL